MPEPSEDNETDRRITISGVHPALIRRYEELVRAPEFHFKDLEDALRAALYSFAAFKERELQRIRREV